MLSVKSLDSCLCIRFGFQWFARSEVAGSHWMWSIGSICGCLFRLEGEDVTAPGLSHQRLEDVAERVVAGGDVCTYPGGGQTVERLRCLIGRRVRLQHPGFDLVPGGRVPVQDALRVVLRPVAALHRHVRE